MAWYALWTKVSQTLRRTYKELGIFNTTLFILTGDNGGIPIVGGNNYPLRGTKATTFEGGVRSIAFASGAGIHPGLRGSVSHELMHLTDWLPTIVEGIAGLSLADNTTGRPCPTCTRRVEPLDGMNQWKMFNQLGEKSQREGSVTGLTIDSEKYSRVCDSYSRIWRHSGWTLETLAWSCRGLARHLLAKRALQGISKSPLPISANTTPPWCPFGWTPPPRADGLFEAPQPPPEFQNARANCLAIPRQMQG